MSQNQNLDAAWQYHSGTKHSYQSLRMNPHSLDWKNKPLLFKIYPTLEVTRLPRDFRETGRPALSAIADCGTATAQRSGELFPIWKLWRSSVLLCRGDSQQEHSARRNFLSRRRLHRGALRNRTLRRLHRSSGKSGAGVKNPPGLAAGVYHFGAAEFGLRQLRAGDFRQALAEATGDDPSVAHAPVTIVCTGTYWRNAWKYRSRTYRHFGWDNGTILANLLAMARSLEASRADRRRIHRLASKRFARPRHQARSRVFVVPIGYQAGNACPLPRKLLRLDLPTVPYSAEEVDYPAMRKMHEASSLDSADEVAAWRGKTPPQQMPPTRRAARDACNCSTIRRFRRTRLSK